jgi:hypothetical protein
MPAGQQQQAAPALQQRAVLRGTLWRQAHVGSVMRKAGLEDRLLLRMCCGCLQGATGRPPRAGRGRHPAPRGGPAGGAGGRLSCSCWPSRAAARSRGVAAASVQGHQGRGGPLQLPDHLPPPLPPRPPRPQIECADFVILNKTDMLPADASGSRAEALGQLMAIVSSLNPLATVMPAQQSKVRAGGRHSTTPRCRITAFGMALPAYAQCSRSLSQLPPPPPSLPCCRSTWSACLAGTPRSCCPV